MNADRAAATYLVLYAELVELTGDFAGALGEAPCPLRPVPAARCMEMCAMLGALGEAFDPEQGGLDQSIASQAERLRQARLKGGATKAAKADEWRLPALRMAKEIRAAHPSWGDEAVAKEILGDPRSGLAALELTAEKVSRWVAECGKRGLIVRSTSYPAKGSAGAP
eukprot:gene18605-25356_t